MLYFSYISVLFKHTGPCCKLLQRQQKLSDLAKTVANLCSFLKLFASETGCLITVRGWELQRTCSVPDGRKPTPTAYLEFMPMQNIVSLTHLVNSSLEIVGQDVSVWALESACLHIQVPEKAGTGYTNCHFYYYYYSCYFIIITFCFRHSYQ